MAGLGDKFRQHAHTLGSTSPGLSLSAGPASLLTEIPLSQIEPDPDQPRRELGNLSELAASIREQGVIQPIIVTIVAYERFRILAGERRFTAAKQAGMLRIPAIVRTMEEHTRRELQLVENLHRKDLSPFEEAETYRRLIADFGLTHEALGKRIGRNQVSVTETLKLLELPERIRREAAESGEGASRISKTVLLEIARRPPAEQMDLWEQARRGTLTVRQVRAARSAPPKKNTGRSKGGRENVVRGGRGFRYPIALFEQDAQVIVEYSTGHPHLEDIVSALEEALTIERARITPSSGQ